MTDMSCQDRACAVDLCLDDDGDGRGVDCDLGPDACDGDAFNWKVIRGGGFHHPTPSYHRVTERSSEDPAATSLNLGFRCDRAPR